MTKGVWRKDVSHVVPVSNSARDMLAHLKPNQEFLCETWRPRNLKHHKWVMALLQVVIENCDRYPDIDALLFALKIATGLSMKYPAADGVHIYVREKSIAFGSMDEDDFTPWSERVVHLIHTKIIPGIGTERLRQAVEEFMAAGNYR